MVSFWHVVLVEKAMRYFIRCLLIFCVFCLYGGYCTAQEGKAKPAGAYTLLGTIKGEVTKVSDGGKRIEVKYTDLVPTTRSSGSSVMTRGSSGSGKFRPPVPKEFGLKEKNFELDLRLVESSVIRVLDTKELPSDSAGSDKKKKAGKQDDKDDADEEAMKTENKTKGKTRPANKGTKKTSEPPLPGKPGDPGSLLKGQVVIVTVHREDLTGFSRLVASTIYILGEK